MNNKGINETLVELINDKIRVKSVGEFSAQSQNRCCKT